MAQPSLQRLSDPFIIASRECVTLSNLPAVKNEQTFLNLVNQLREEITRQLADLKTSITIRLDARYHLYNLLHSRRLTILFIDGNIGSRPLNSTINNPDTIPQASGSL